MPRTQRGDGPSRDFAPRVRERDHPTPKASVPPRTQARGSQSALTPVTKPTTKKARVDRPRAPPRTMSATGRRSTLNWALYSWTPAFGRVARRNSCRARPWAPYDVPPTIVMPRDARATPRATSGTRIARRRRRMLDVRAAGNLSSREPWAYRDFDTLSG